MHDESQRCCNVYTNCIKRYHLNVRLNFENLIHISYISLSFPNTLQSCRSSIHQKSPEVSASYGFWCFLSDSGLGNILYLDLISIIFKLYQTELLYIISLFINSILQKHLFYRSRGPIIYSLIRKNIFPQHSPLFEAVWICQRSDKFSLNYLNSWFNLLSEVRKTFHLISLTSCFSSFIIYIKIKNDINQ